MLIIISTSSGKNQPRSSTTRLPRDSGVVEVEDSLRCAERRYAAKSGIFVGEGSAHRCYSEELSARKVIADFRATSCIPASYSIHQPKIFLHRNCHAAILFRRNWHNSGPPILTYLACHSVSISVASGRRRKPQAISASPSHKLGLSPVDSDTTFG